ncbi:ThiF family adenylyltransferase [Maricaulis sp. CAU 1757]
MTGWPNPPTSIRETLRQIGFERSADPNRYSGELNFGHKRLRVTLHVPDIGFLSKPEVYVDDLSELPNGARPHLEGPNHNRVCYAAPGTLRLDPYDPGGSVLAVLKMAEDTLADSLGVRPLSAITMEYSSYWGDRGFYLVDDPPAGVSSWSALQANTGIFLSRTAQNSRSSNRSAVIVKVDRNLEPVSDEVVPKTVQQLSEWWEKNALNSILPFKQVKDRLQEDIWVFTKGQNACLGVHLLPSPPVKGSKHSTRLPKAILNAAPLQHATAEEASARFVTQRCLGNQNEAHPPLGGKHIALIGCGTIGSFLAPLLVRSGAGACGGKLVLVDPESISPANLGRHACSFHEIGRNKAEAVAEQVSRFHPKLNVESHDNGIEHVWARLGGCQVLIDATGTENVSEWINRQHLNEERDRHVIYSWIVQEGAAVQSFASRSQGSGACYRCIRPSLANSARHSPLKDSCRRTDFIYGTCGDGAYVPFSVATSVAAAALALEATVAVISESTAKNLWTRVTDFGLAKSGSNRDQLLEKSDECPACSNH